MLNRRSRTRMGVRVGAMLAVVASVTLGVSSANAATTGAAYVGWSVSGTTGTVTMPTGYPKATWATTPSSQSISVYGGAGTVPNGSTPWGAVFGSASNKQYGALQLPMSGVVGGSTASVTFTFATPMPAGSFGINLGDVDAENVTVTAAGPNGALTGVELGSQGAYNYAGQSDVPTVSTAANSIVVTGNANDTNGAAAWLKPTVAVSTLTFTSTNNVAGSPAFQMWFAAFTNTVSGSVTQPAESKPISTIEVTPPGSSTVLGETTPENGSFSIPVAPGQYDLVPVYTDGSLGSPIPVDASNGDVSGVAVTASVSLAATGSEPAGWAALSALMLTLGAALVLLVERSRNVAR